MAANTPIWNRKNDKTGGFVVMRGMVGGRPGEEVAITDENFTLGNSCLMDRSDLRDSLTPRR